MNRILFGEALIDVDEIVDVGGIGAAPLFAEEIPTDVKFRDGHSRILWGVSKSAFDAWAKGNTPSCQTCEVFDDDEERCTWTIGHVAFPKCYEPVSRREAAHPLCKTCRTYHDQGKYGWCKGDARPYPECYEKSVRALWKACNTCVNYLQASDERFAVHACKKGYLPNGDLECYEERKEKQCSL